MEKRIDTYIFTLSLISTKILALVFWRKSGTNYKSVDHLGGSMGKADQFLHLTRMSRLIYPIFILHLQKQRVIFHFLQLYLFKIWNYCGGGTRISGLYIPHIFTRSGWDRNSEFEMNWEIILHSTRHITILNHDPTGEWY